MKKYCLVTKCWQGISFKKSAEINEEVGSVNQRFLSLCDYSLIFSQNTI